MWSNRQNWNRFQIHFGEFAQSVCELSVLHVHSRATDICFDHLTLSLRTFVHTFVISRVDYNDYCNTMLAGSPMFTTNRPRVLNVVTRVVSGTGKFDSGLKQLRHFRAALDGRSCNYVLEMGQYIYRKYRYIVSISIYRIISYRPLQYRKIWYIENLIYQFFRYIDSKSAKVTVMNQWI